MPDLRLSDGRIIKLTRITDSYFQLGEHKKDFLYDDSKELDKSTEPYTLKEKEFDAQLRAYLDGALDLARGITRHHPLFYEVRLMGVLAPLGVGSLPDWATNTTAYIPFGPPDGAVGIAMGRDGMGPGDNQRALADYPQLCAAKSKIEVGLVIPVTVRPGTGVAFYSAGEIQVKGPRYDKLAVQPIRLAATDLAKPMSQDDQAAYLLEHGGLRHHRTVSALDKYGDKPLLAIGEDATLRRGHAEMLLQMRERLEHVSRGVIDLVITGTTPDLRPGNRTDDNYRAYLDSSVNREAHDAYLAAVLAGQSPNLAANAGVDAGTRWLTQLFSVLERDKAALKRAFPEGWEKQ